MIIEMNNLSIMETFEELHQEVEKWWSKVKELQQELPRWYNNYKYSDESIEFYFNRISERTGMPFEGVVQWINSIIDVYPVAAFSILLREIAVYLDYKYPDHIRESESIYVISVEDGTIKKQCKSHIKNYENFAAFRSIEDAKKACKILKPMLKSMFKNESK